MGLIQLLGHNFHDGLQIPEERRISILAKQLDLPKLKLIEPLAKDLQAEYLEINKPVVKVNILCIVRSNSYKARMVYNYQVLKKELIHLQELYPLKLKDNGVSDFKLVITLSEHLDTMTLKQTLAAFANADIVFGPHGAGNNKL